MFVSVSTGIQSERGQSNILANLCSRGDWFESRFVGNEEDIFCLYRGTSTQAFIRNAVASRKFD